MTKQIGSKWVERVGCLGLIVISFLMIGPCIYSCSRPAPTQEADKISEVKQIKYVMQNGMLNNALSLTMLEESATNYNGREIYFLDYGFDGNLDSVRINQRDRIDVNLTNQEDLARWQPFYEQIRDRRFGKYGLKRN
jgi:hypothetical protein